MKINPIFRNVFLLSAILSGNAFGITIVKEYWQNYGDYIFTDVAAGKACHKNVLGISSTDGVTLSTYSGPAYDSGNQVNRYNISGWYVPAADKSAIWPTAAGGASPISTTEVTGQDKGKFSMGDMVKTCPLTGTSYDNNLYLMPLTSAADKCRMVCGTPTQLNPRTCAAGFTLNYDGTKAGADKYNCVGPAPYPKDSAGNVYNTQLGGNGSNTWCKPGAVSLNASNCVTNNIIVKASEDPAAKVCPAGTSLYPGGLKCSTTRFSAPTVTHHMVTEKSGTTIPGAKAGYTISCTTPSDPIKGIYSSLILANTSSDVAVGAYVEGGTQCRVMTLSDPVCPTGKVLTQEGKCCSSGLVFNATSNKCEKREAEVYPYLASACPAGSVFTGTAACVRPTN